MTHDNIASNNDLHYIYANHSENQPSAFTNQ